jgi:hypothetical protein
MTLGGTAQQRKPFINARFRRGMMISTRGFQNLYFGMASTESEVRSQQGAERFFRTFYDRWNLRKRVDSKSFFLVIGPKGAGKSAINEFIRLHLVDKHGEHAVFTQTLNLDEVGPGLTALSEISSKLVSNQPNANTEQAWRLFFSLRLFDLMINDQSCSLVRDPQSLRLHRSLQETGLASSDYPSILRRVRENKLSISFKGLGGEGTSKQTDQLPVTQVSEALVRLILAAKSANHFMLSIDGLDRIIGDNPAYWATLAALLRVADDLHNRLTTAAADIRLFIMCRSDVLRRIRFADADKISGDSSLFIDWGAQQTIPIDSALWDYLATKAEISVEQLFAYFPGTVTVGQRVGRPRTVAIADYLLQVTRSTPRELTLLMKRIQDQLPSRGYITSERVRAAVDEFASRDLLTIVIAESTGILHDKLGDNLDDILSAIPAASNVTKSDLTAAVTAAGLDADLTDDLAEFMFMAGLLGNFDPETGYVQFYHRRDTYKFKRNGPWVLHNALMYAFNIPYSRSHGR